jgi:hypothetical protein
MLWYQFTMLTKPPLSAACAAKEDDKMAKIKILDAAIIPTP